MSPSARSQEAPRRGLLRRVRDMLAEPRLAGIDIDSSDLIAIHRQILLEKAMLCGVFRELYTTCMDLDAKFFFAAGIQVEIGAGSSLFKHFFPAVISSDIKPAPHLDMVVDAQDMPFEDGSVRGIYGINCFHHFPQPEQFLRELDRVLAPGGGCVIIDPHYGAIATRFYERLFESEHFNKAQLGWTADSITVMRGANQALSYIVLVRDRDLFRSRFPTLEIVYEKPMRNYARYVLSGGLNFRSLLPGFMEPAIRLAEYCLVPLAPVLALHHVVVLRKRT